MQECSGGVTGIYAVYLKDFYKEQRLFLKKAVVYHSKVYPLS